MNFRSLVKWLLEIDDRRLMTGDRQSVVFVIWRYRGFVKLYTFWDYWLQSSWYKSCNRAQLCRYMMYRWHGSTEYDPEHCWKILNEADVCQSYIAEYDSESVSGIQSYEITMPNEMPTPPRRSWRWQMLLHNWISESTPNQILPNDMAPDKADQD